MNGAHKKQQNLGIEVKITDQCNLSCFHCMNNDGPSKVRNIDTDFFIKSLTEFQDTRKPGSLRIDHIRMTGGEPLMNLDAVLKTKYWGSVGFSAGRSGVRDG